MYKNFTVSNVIISLCAMVFLAEFLGGYSVDGVALYYWESPSFSPYQLLSHQFVHGGVLHLLLNMMALWMFGRVLEGLWGSLRFLLFYVACGIGAATIYQLVSYYQFHAAIEPLLAAGFSSHDLFQLFSNERYYPQYPSSQRAVEIFASPVVGASGAIYGILAAFALRFPNHKLIFLLLPFPIAAKFFVPLLLCLDVYALATGHSLLGVNIAHAAHLGGALVGFILVLLILRNKKRLGNKNSE
ncbi:rhomboid family intramembrane serine protease [Eionea flava]